MMNPLHMQLTKFEETRLVGTRAEQLAKGAKPTINVSYGMSMVDIATEEYKLGTIPLSVIRPMPDGSKTIVKINAVPYNGCGSFLNRDNCGTCKKCILDYNVMYLYYDKVIDVKAEKEEVKTTAKDAKASKSKKEPVSEEFDISQELLEDNKDKKIYRSICVWTREPFMNGAGSANSADSKAIYVFYRCFNSKKEHSCKKFTLEEWNTKERLKYSYPFSKKIVV